MPKLNRSLLYSSFLLFNGILSLVTPWYSILISSLIILLVVMMLDNLGKGIILREVIGMFYAFTCLLMPLIGYEFYSSENQISSLWVKYMPVSDNTYFSYAIPAIIFFCFTITFPISLTNELDKGEGLMNTVKRIKDILISNKWPGIIILLIGSLSSFFIIYLPGSLQFFAYLIFFSSFAGLLYVFFSPQFMYKKIIMTAFVLFIVYNALQSGMFTVVAYMSITIFSFFFLGRGKSLIKKSIFFILGLCFVLVLQNTKLSYRKLVWKKGYEGNTASLFVNLFVENLQKGSNMFEDKAFFPSYVRMNQGFNVALVMKRIPILQPFDEGKNLFINISSSLVPRFLWPNKPEAGGKANMLYYAGWRLRGWSTNVGPLGEAYASFGGSGGIIFMSILGLFIRWGYKKLFLLAQRIPLLLFWLPVLFFQIVYSAENDTLQILNSLLKSALFIFIIYKTLPFLFIPKESKIHVRQKPALQY